MGYQIVLLDEHGQELRREPDIYEAFGQDYHLDDEDHEYALLRTAIEEDQQVRYFQRVKAQS